MWIPESENDLEQSLRAGTLIESHRVDFKRELGPSKPRQNRALAKDIASFAVDGGVVLVGIAEEEEGLALSPIPLDGLRERIEQIAASRVEPPLSVVCRTFPSIKNGANGYLAIIVPPSPEAPHMVDGVYYGRGDSTNRRLSDGEVLRLHERRLTTQVAALDRLSLEVDRDFSPGNEQAHMHVVALPTGARDDLLLRALEETQGAAGAKELMSVVREVLMKRLSVSFGPDFDAFGPSRRARGWGLHSASVTTDRQPSESAREGRILDPEIGENGSLNLFCDRASDSIGEGPRLLIEDLVAGLTLRVVLVATRISQLTGYLGTWDFGLAITNVRGCVSNAMASGRRYYGTPYSSDDYRQTTRVSASKLSDGGGEVLQLLFGPFGRALNNGQVDLPVIRGG